MGKLPDIYYEQYVLGELDDRQRAEVEAAPDFDARIEEIQRSNDEILDAYPAAEFAKRIRNAYEAETGKSAANAGTTHRKARLGSLLGRQSGGNLAGAFFGRPIATFGVSAALVAVVAVAALVVGGFAPTATESLRTKGLDAKIRIYRDAGTDVEVLAPDQSVSEGDLLQISYNAAGGRYGTIFSVDGRGTFTLHYPTSIDDSTAVESTGEVLLPYAYRLDDAPRFEKFYFLTSEERLDLDSIIDAVSRQIDRQQEDPEYEMQFDQDLSVSSLILRKTE